MKYYIKSGELEKIVIANSPSQACVKAIHLTNGETLDKCFYVDERGFRQPPDTISTLLPEYVISYDVIINTVGEDNEN